MKVFMIGTIGGFYSNGDPSCDCGCYTDDSYAHCEEGGPSGTYLRQGAVVELSTMYPLVAVEWGMPEMQFACLDCYCSMADEMAGRERVYRRFCGRAGSMLEYDSSKEGS